MKKREGKLPIPIATFYFDPPFYTGPRGVGSLGRRRTPRKCGLCREPGHRAPECPDNPDKENI